MTSGLVSIIIPVFNREKLISETLISIQNQSYINWECIVVDDGSTDETAEIVDSFTKIDSRIKFFHRPVDLSKGANSCRNYGFEMSSGEFINWFDSDDVMLADFLEKKVDAFTPMIDFVISSGFHWNPISTAQTPLIIEPTKDLYADFAMWKAQIITNAVIFRKSFLENKPLFNPEMKRGQEAEYFTRLFFECQPNQYLIIPHFGFLYRQHDDSKSNRNIAYNKGYKESLFFFLMENFRRSEQIKSKELLDYFYAKLIKLLFTSNSNLHHEVTKGIIHDFFPLLKKYNYFKATEMMAISKLMISLHKSPYRLRNRWLNFKFNWNG